MLFALIVTENSYHFLNSPLGPLSKIREGMTAPQFPFSNVREGVRG